MTSKARSKSTNKKPVAEAGMLATELRDMASRLREAVDNVIVAQTAEDICFHYEAFAGALSIVNDTQVCLGDMASKLETAEVQS
jgi:hypothetical protein